MDEFTHKMCESIANWAKHCENYSIDTIYFGGGTPSLLGGDRLCQMLAQIQTVFSVQPDAEITVECNPDSMDAHLLERLNAADVNRLSIGVQSAQNMELRTLGRRHTFEQAENAIQLAYQYGFSNISLDLMYGLPEQTLDKVLDSIQSVLTFTPAHLSCYGLKLEENTPLWRKNPLLPDDDLQADMYLAICERLKEAGYLHYEISNWAKPGFASRHNSRYWDLSEYLGIGPSAHSFFGGKRFAYHRDFNQFLAGIPPCPEETVADFPPALEYLMLALRTANGIQPDEFEARFSVSFTPFLQRLQFFQPHGFTVLQNGHWRLTEQGFLLSNTILADILSAV